MSPASIGLDPTSDSVGPSITTPRVLVAGTTSGVGKTTFTAGLLAALRRRGLRVQPFKVGPDYIDPGYLSAAAGRPCRNLDEWILPPSAVLELFAHASRETDLAVIEGMMGLFDGRDDRDEGSTASVARCLGAPILLLIDVGKTSRSAAAIALGYRQLDQRIQVVGVILNNVAGPRHYRWTASAIQSLAGLPVLGYLPARPDLAVPERHLGLVPAGEQAAADEYLARLATQVEETVDVPAVVAIARQAALLRAPKPVLFPSRPMPPEVRLGIARDAAFGFYYQDSLDLLEAWGARLIPFSPLHDADLPAVEGLYLGGGFPEVFAERLAANHALHAAIRHAAASGLPIYAECGGLMYLSEGITDPAGRRWPMVGLVPAWSVMGDRPIIGYRDLIALHAGPFFDQGDLLHGHEFHHSSLDRPLPPACALYRLVGTGRFEGYTRGSLFASYVHLHLGTGPDLARRLVDFLRRARL